MSSWTLSRSNPAIRCILDFVPILVAGLLLYLPCLAFPPLSNGSLISSLCQVTRMCTNVSTPWGAVTSLSLFDGTDNLATFLVCGMMFIRINIEEPSRERAKRSLFFLITSFASAITANFVWMLLNPSSWSYGQSGVIYSFMATLLAFMCYKGLPRSGFRNLKLDSRKSALYLVLSIASIVVVILLFTTPLKSAMFYGQDLNAFVHEVAFLMTFLLTVPFYYFGQTRLGQNLKMACCETV